MCVYVSEMNKEMKKKHFTVSCDYKLENRLSKIRQNRIKLYSGEFQCLLFQSSWYFRPTNYTLYVRVYVPVWNDLFVSAHACTRSCERAKRKRVNYVSLSYKSARGMENAMLLPRSPCRFFPLSFITPLWFERPKVERTWFIHWWRIWT